ncbi:MAG: hypothetical protein C0485_18640 [Pirellula sp.]|nr:hypothetical protein [Pirellula sp.]
MLTLAAPWSWHRTRSARLRAAADAKSHAPEAAPAPPKKPAKPLALLYPTVPPLAAPTAPEPELSGPMVFADDYVAVDEPLVEQKETAQEVAAAEPFSLRAKNRSVLIKNTAPPAAPSIFTKQSLTKVRDAILVMVEQARQAQAAQTEAAAAAQPAYSSLTFTSPMRVVVESEHDRLAMIPPKDMRIAGVPELTAEPNPARPAAPLAPLAKPALQHRPTALIAQLEALTAGSPASPWAQHVLARIEQLTDVPAPADHNWQPTIVELRQLAAHGFNQALTVTNPADQSSWVRASRSLERRLPVWTLLVDRQFMSEQAASLSDALNNNAGLLQALNDVAVLTAGSEEGATWREYLRVDEAAGLASVGGDMHGEARRAVARDVLVRIDDPWLTAAQRQFLAQPQISNLAVELRPWASGEASVDTLAAFMERYEATGALHDADAMAELRLRMKWSADPRLQALAEDLNRHYRNANMRVAFSGELMNRMIPPQEVRKAPVRSRIVGADVRGRSETETQVHVRLIPDAMVWRFGLEAVGNVNSNTVSETWPAKLRNRSTMEYEARKLIMINRFGLHAWPAEAQADGRTSLVGIDSGFSSVPILGTIVENVAREQHQQNRGQAVAQVKSRVKKEARERMDAETEPKLASFESRFREHVLEPMGRFAIVAEPVDMSTTEDRVQARLRLATEQHLGAHTPRPSAPSDSLASFQLHESAFNNALRGLDLDGKRLTVAELHQALSEKIRRHAEAPPADLPKAAKVEFAKNDAVRIICHGDRIELIMNIVELRHGRDNIRGVGVHAFFRPVVDGLELKLVRDGSLQFSGAHLRTGPRMVLHSVFGKMLPKDQELPVLAAKLNEDPRFAGLMVTQLVIDDGWVAVSIGPALPNRTAWRTRTVDLK